MPSYISHAIMGDNLYKEAFNDKRIFKCEVNYDSLKTFSLGIDLTVLAKSLPGDIHNIKTQELLLNLIKYVKENNLVEDSEALAFMYGHISHYFFDTNAHPLIYYVERGCQKVGIIPTHMMVEGYIDSYFITKILKRDYMDIDESFFNKGNLNNPKIKKLISSLYSNVYQTSGIYSSYKNVIRLFSIIEFGIKNPIVSKELLIKFSSFDRFLEINNLSLNEITNKNRNQWKVPVTGETRNESLLDLYNRALEMTLYAYQRVNDYLYNGKTLDTLENLFSNISYDTGVSLSLGYNMLHKR